MAHVWIAECCSYPSYCVARLGWAVLRDDDAVPRLVAELAGLVVEEDRGGGAVPRQALPDLLMFRA